MNQKIVLKTMALSLILSTSMLLQSCKAKEEETTEDTSAVVEEAPAKDQPGTLLADSRAIGVRHRGARELDVLDGRPIAGDHPDGLALRRSAVGAQVRTATRAANDQPVRDRKSVV